MAPYPIIHINGFPGTGKLTVANHLTKLLSNKAKLVHNHLLINPADAILERTQPGYQDLRHAVRSAVLSALIHEPATYDTAYVFTDFQSSDSLGTSVCAEFAAAALARGSAFVPIVLSCSEEANLERLVSAERTLHRKLTDVELVRRFRRNVQIHRFEGCPHMLEMDVTDMSPAEAARRVLEHVLMVCPDLKGNMYPEEGETLPKGKKA